MYGGELRFQRLYPVEVPWLRGAAAPGRAERHQGLPSRQPRLRQDHGQCECGYHQEQSRYILLVF